MEKMNLLFLLFINILIDIVGAKKKEDFPIFHQNFCFQSSIGFDILRVNRLLTNRTLIVFVVD